MKRDFIEDDVEAAVDNPYSMKSSSNDNDDDDDDDDLPVQLMDKDVIRTVLRVVAPHDLPVGYRLEVTCDNATYFVQVPAGNSGGGVRKGETFETTQVFAKPILERWSDDIVNLSSAYEGNFCYLALFCPSLAFAAILESLGLNCLGRPPTTAAPSPPKTVLWVLLMMVVLYLISGFNDNISGAIPIVCLGTMTRGIVRKKYKIQGSVFNDCMWTFFCSCCTALQIFRHMKRSGEQPKCCKPRPHKAQIV